MGRDMINSGFLQSLLDHIPPCNAKLNAFAIISILDKIDTYSTKTDFYEDIKIVLDATTGKTIGRK